MHTQGDISDDNPIILPGDGIARARFGSSVVNIGDVNDDGYEGTCTRSYMHVHTSYV